MGSLKIFIASAALAAALAGPASADVPVWDSSGAGMDQGDASGYSHDGNDGFGPRGGGSSVVENDTAGFQLLMYGSKGTVRAINSLGVVSVRRSRPPISIGQNNNGALHGGTRGTVLASWDEIVHETYNTIVVNISSSDGQDLMPLGVVNELDPSEEFNFWTWNFGVNDPVTLSQRI